MSPIKVLDIQVQHANYYTSSKSVVSRTLVSCLARFSDAQLLLMDSESRLCDGR